MHITNCDCLALNEAVLVYARMNRVTIGRFQITTTVFFNMPTGIFVTLWLAVSIFARTGLRCFNRCCINNVNPSFGQYDICSFKLMVDLSQKALPQTVLHQLMAEPP